MRCLFIIIFNLEADSKIITSSINFIENLKSHFQIFSTDFSIFQKTFEIFFYEEVVQLNKTPLLKKNTHEWRQHPNWKSLYYTIKWRLDSLFRIVFWTRGLTILLLNLYLYFFFFLRFRWRTHIIGFHSLSPNRSSIILTNRSRGNSLGILGTGTSPSQRDYYLFNVPAASSISR